MRHSAEYPDDGIGDPLRDLGDRALALLAQLEGDHQGVQEQVVPLV